MYTFRKRSNSSETIFSYLLRPPSSLSHLNQSLLHARPWWMSLEQPSSRSFCNCNAFAHRNYIETWAIFPLHCCEFPLSSETSRSFVTVFLLRDYYSQKAYICCMVWCQAAAGHLNKCTQNTPPTATELTCVLLKYWVTVDKRKSWMLASMNKHSCTKKKTVQTSLWKTIDFLVVHLVVLTATFLFYVLVCSIKPKIK